MIADRLEGACTKGAQGRNINIFVDTALYTHFTATWCQDANSEWDLSQLTVLDWDALSTANQTSRL